MISCKEICFSPLFIKYDSMNSIKCKESMLAFYAMMIKIQEIIERHAQISAKIQKEVCNTVIKSSDFMAIHATLILHLIKPTVILINNAYSGNNK
jgi:hypothetical protein